MVKKRFSGLIFQSLKILIISVIAIASLLLISQWLISVNGSVTHANEFLKSKASTFFVIRIFVISLISFIYHMWSKRKIKKAIEDNEPLSDKRIHDLTVIAQNLNEALLLDDNSSDEDIASVRHELQDLIGLIKPEKSPNEKLSEYEISIIKFQLSAVKALLMPKISLSEKEIKRLSLIGNGWLCFAVLFGLSLLLMVI